MTEVPVEEKATAKTLAEKKTGSQRNAQQLQKTKGKIVEYAWFLKKEGYKHITIINHSRKLELLVKRGADLFNPESVKEVIAQQAWCESTKALATAIYSTFLRYIGLKWSPPKYKLLSSKTPFIPTEKEIDALIAGCGKKLATFLQLLKETAMRAGEARNLGWVDIDVERNVVRVTPEKGSNPRLFKVSTKLVQMLNALPKTNEKVFPVGCNACHLYPQRIRTARKLQNPRLLQIHFHTLRHWKATLLYHQTKDILYVMKFLGHKSIESTLVYIQLEEALFQESDEWTVRVAETVDEATKLLEAGFEYVTDMDNKKLFRKRK